MKTNTTTTEHRVTRERGRIRFGQRVYAKDLANKIICAGLAVPLSVCLVPVGALAQEEASQERSEAVEVVDLAGERGVSQGSSHVSDTAGTNSGKTERETARHASESGPSSSISSSSLADVADTAIDLTALVAAQEASSATVITLTEGGTYRLTGDTTTSKRIEVKAASADVVIDLGPYSLTFDTPRQELSSLAQGLVVRSASSVVVKGALSEVKSDQLVLVSSSKTQGLGAAIVCSAAACDVCLADLGIRVSGIDEGTQLRTLSAQGIRATKGTLALEGVAVTVDLSNQTEVNNTVSAMKGAPVGVYVGSNVKGARVVDSTVEVLNTPNVAVSTTTKEEQPGSAYGVYSLISEYDLQVSASSIHVDAPIGIATGVYAKALALENARDCGELSEAKGLTVNVNAKQRALAVNAAGDAGSAILNGELTVSYDGASSPATRCALYSASEEAYVIGREFKGSGLDVLVGSLNGAMNGDGVRFATFVADVPAVEREAMSHAFKNGLRAGNACALSSDERGLFFELDIDGAQALVKTPGGEDLYCSSAQEALNAATPGSTVSLLAHADGVTFAAHAQADEQFVLDLNGYTLASLSATSAGHLTVTDSKDSGSITGPVVVGDSAQLSLQGLSVIAFSQTQNVVGVRVGANARFEARSCSIQVSSSSMAVCAICADGAGDASIVVDGCRVGAVTYSAREAANGVVSHADQGTVRIVGSEVLAQSVAGNCGAVEAVTDVEVSSSRLEATASHSASSVWGVKLTGDGARASVMESSVAAQSLEPSTSGEYWCLQLDDALAPSNVATWILDGTCAFTSANETIASLCGEPLVLGASFSTTQGSISIRAIRLTDNVFAMARDRTADISSLASLFVSVPNGMWEGWAIEPTDDTAALKWTRSAAVANTTSGVSYTSLTEAIEAASSGDVLVMQSDFMSPSLSIDKPMTIDLAGHTLTVSSYGEASTERAGGAIRYTASGALTLCDSNEGAQGRIRLLVGENHEASASTATYVGVLMRGGAVAVHGCEVEVLYDGVGAATGLSLVGVSVEAGTLSLEDGAKLSVGVSGEATALDMTGVALARQSAGATTSPDSSISVKNETAASLAGAVSTTVRQSTNSSVANRGSNLVQMYLDEDGDLYREIQEKFKLKAKYDGTYPADETDTTDIVYGSRVYYAAQLALDNGLLVWAYSDPVPADEVGPVDNVVATSFFTSSRYSVVPSASGIKTDDAFTGSIDIAGSIAATCAEGDAVGVVGSEATSCVIKDSATIAAQGGSEPLYRLGSTFDLRDHISLGAAVSEVVQYPKNDKENLVTYEYPLSSAVSSAMRAAGSATTIQSGASFEEREEEPCRLTGLPNFSADTVRVSVCGMRDTSGSLVASTSASLAQNDSLEGLVAQVSEAADYNQGGVRYHFVGWTVRESSNTRVYSADAIASGEIRVSDLPGASEGAVTLDACYVAAGEGQSVITFVIDSFAHSYVASDGVTPNYALVQAGQGVETPSKIIVEENTDYAFSGWSDAEGVLHRGSLPSVKGDAVYVANYDSTSSSLSVKFTYWGQSNGNLTRKTSSATVSYGSDPSEVAAELMKDNASFVLDGDQSYRFVGWTARGCDDSALFGTQLPQVSESVTYYAVYSQSSIRYTVTFLVGDVIHAVATEVSPLLTIDQVINAAGVASPEGSETQTFRGWALSADAKTIVRTGIKKVSDLVEQGSTTLALYALFNKQDDAGTTGGEGSEGGNESGGGSSITPVDPAVDDDDEANIIHTSAIVRQEDPGAVSVSGSGGRTSAVESRTSTATDGSGTASSSEVSQSLSAVGSVENAGTISGKDADGQGAVFSGEGDAANTVAFLAAFLAALVVAASVIRRAFLNGKLDRASDEEEKRAVSVTKNIEF